jgi:hypothetical protein
MSLILTDGFDFYSTMSDALAGVWDSGVTGGYTLISTGTRLGVGQAFSSNTGATGNLIKSSGSNNAGHHLVMARKSAIGGTSAQIIDYFLLSDVNTGQVAICFMGDGSIQLRSGSSGGTTLATYAAGLSLNLWYGIEFEVIINATTGSFSVRINGATSNSFSATGLNTCPGSNVYANKLAAFSEAGALSGTVYYDDFMWFSTSGAAPNTWVGDVRAMQQMPLANSTVALTASPATVTNSPPVNSVMTVSQALNTQVSSQVVTCATTGSCVSLTVNTNTAYTGNYKLALYDSTGTGGSPGALLGETAQVTNAVALSTITTALITPVAVTAGTKYYGALLADTAFPVAGWYTGSNIGYSVSRAYTSDFLTTFGVAAANANQPPYVSMIVAPANAAVAGNATEDGDTTFVYGSTASTGDLYTLPALATTPSNIVAVVTRMMARKSDTGTRTAEVQISSAGTVSAGTTITLGTSYAYTSRADLVDPATGVAWTASGVNALLIGPYIVA